MVLYRLQLCIDQLWPCGPSLVHLDIDQVKYRELYRILIQIDHLYLPVL